MPLNTVNRTYPYPVDADLIDVAGDFNRLAAAVDFDIERRGSELRAHYNSNAVADSPPRGSAWQPLAFYSVPFTVGHLYEVTAKATFYHPGAAGSSGGVTTRILIGALTLQYEEVFLPNATVAVPCTSRGLWLADATGSQVVSYDGQQAWWSGNQWVTRLNAGHPLYLAVEDHGTLIP